jgi:hypothetical protein
LLHCFQAKYALLPRREPGFAIRIDLMLPLRRKSTMRWKISHNGHDPRQIDLFAVLALIILIGIAFEFFSRNQPPPSTSALIVPSQNVRW